MAKCFHFRNGNLVERNFLLHRVRDQFSDNLVHWFDFDFPLGGNGSPASYENHPLVPSPDARCFRIIAFPRE